MKYISAKTILSGYSSNDSWFGNNYTMNIYRGCCHGCIYCDSRSECYHVENFDEVRAKENALIVLENELKSKRKSGVIGTGAMSDPYNPFEKVFCLTRGALKLVHKYGFGASITTKSDLVVRDLDILKKIQDHSPVLVQMTITTWDDKLCKKVEPNVVVSSKRFSAIRELSKEGIFVGLLLMPVLPFLQDNEEDIRKIVELASENGAKYIYPAFGVTLRQNQRVWYYEKLEKQFPGMKEKYVHHFGNAYECYSPKSKELWQLFRRECKKYGIFYKMEDIIKGYKNKYETTQISLFD